MVEKSCISCKISIANNRGSVIFTCPKCGEYEIIRCQHCRAIAAKFKCPNCSFEGPN